MDLHMFGADKPGTMVAISGTDPTRGPWSHFAFLPDPLPPGSPTLTGATYRVVANARASLAALDSTALQLPNPKLLRRAALRYEAQSTSALEGTYEPLAKVLTAADDPQEPRMREVINYQAMAEYAFEWMEHQRPLTLSMLCELQLTLVRGTPLQNDSSGMIRPVQAVIGRRSGVPESEFPVRDARFVPSPPGVDLQARVRDLLDWFAMDTGNDVDPIVAAAMVHYQFETLHPFPDGNGRIGRLMILLQLAKTGALSEPTLTVSPWFEARPAEYYDRLLGVSTLGDWDSWVSFFARGIGESAVATRRQMLALVAVQASLKEQIRRSSLRADTAHILVDFAVSQVTFTVRQVEKELGISYGRANKLVTSLIDLGVLAELEGLNYNRRFYAPEVLRVLLEAQTTATL